MTAEAKFEVYNDNNNLVINESYKNLYLSRIVAGNTLPMEYISQANGSYIYGSYLARRIDFMPERDEFFAAVAAPVGQGCNFFVYNNLVDLGSKAYLCAAQRYYQSEYITVGIGWWDDPDHYTETGMSDTSVVPNGIDVFIFARSDKDTSSPTGKKQSSDNAGLQIFNASGDCVYDSRFKSAKIVGIYSPIDRRIAVSSVWSGAYRIFISREYAPGRKTFDHYDYIIAGFGTTIKSYSNPNPHLPDEYYCVPTVCMSLTGASPTTQYVLGQNEYSCLFFDVTNF